LQVEWGGEEKTENRKAKSEKRREEVRGVPSEEPTLRTLREGWGTLKHKGGKRKPGEQQTEEERAYAESTEGAEGAENRKPGERKGRGVRSEEPTLRTLREGWGTLKIIWMASLE